MELGERKRKQRSDDWYADEVQVEEVGVGKLIHQYELQMCWRCWLPSDVLMRWKHEMRNTK
jgi:hypothetical protein